MQNVPSAYEALTQSFRQIALLGESIGVLHWDQSVMMPPNGSAARADQIAALSILRHDMITAPALADKLAEAASLINLLDPWQAANLREMKRAWVHANALPSDLVEAKSLACSHCENVWQTAREDDDFAAVQPLLAEVLNLTRQAAEAKADALAVEPYDALLDSYEPAGRSHRIDPIFDDYAAFLPDFLDDVLSKQSSTPAPRLPEGPFPVERQRQLCQQMAAAIGLEFDGARLDESAHPFSTGVPEDSRITTRYDEADFTTALMGVLHETGHAMYERGRPQAWRYQPVGTTRGMTMHESQSLLVEMQACRSASFYAWAAPVIQACFGGKGSEWEADNLHKLAIRVERSFIRVDADEVTYPAHVILRYRLEKALLADELPLDELQAAWNDGFEKLLGVRPPNDRLGCLQDIHWYGGDIGYFPTYTLGAMAAAQLYEAAVEEKPGIRDGLANGNFSPLMAWLGDRVHGVASYKSTDQIIEEATGRPFDQNAFKRHLQRRYLG